MYLKLAQCIVKTSFLLPILVCIFEDLFPKLLFSDIVYFPSNSKLIGLQDSACNSHRQQGAGKPFYMLEIITASCGPGALRKHTLDGRLSTRDGLCQFHEGCHARWRRE